MSELLQKARDYEIENEGAISKSERPLFHLTPRIGWMNDPNGFSFYKGKYHLFYQYNPYDTKWDSMYWGHAVSTDLLNWEYLPCALAPDKDYDEYGCFSGSAIEIPGGKHLLMYTGCVVEKQSSGEAVSESERILQTQCLAIGDGIDYEKVEGNPALAEKSLPEGGSKYDFRDPKIWREDDGSYACVVGNRTKDESGAILRFRSQDGVNWRYDCTIARSGNKFGKMWECPDFFSLDGKDVLIVSPQEMEEKDLEFHNGNNSICFISDSYKDKKVFSLDNAQSLDYGLDFYAPQTMLSPDGRRIMIAWMQNWESSRCHNAHQKWMGQMTLPREISIKDGRLIQNPIREIEQFRKNRVYEKTVISGESGELSIPDVSGRTLDMTVNVTPLENESYRKFILKFAMNEEHFSLISYKPEASKFCIDRSHSGFCYDVVHKRKCLVKNQGGAIKIRVILDRFSAEVFVNDGEQSVSTVIHTPIDADGISFELQNGKAQLEIEKYDIEM